MDAEVVAIGTELLLGQIVDTNSAWIGEHLALAGIGTYQQHKVGDNIDRICSVISDALGRSDAVICCGGLGPTQDDLTREAVARVAGSELVFDDDRADLIRAMFGSRARNMPDNNLLQAYRPAVARFIEQQPGTAPGLVCPVVIDGVEKLIFAVPGVPWEMQEMMFGTVIPELRERSGDTRIIKSRTLKTWGESESGLAERLAQRIEELDSIGNPTLAFLASGIEGLKVRITAAGESDAIVDAVIAAEEQLLREMLGGVVFGADDDTIESVVLDELSEHGLTLGLAESLTGGLMAGRLVGVSGASGAFRGGVVAYNSDIKFDLLGVDRGPVITEECAAQMAAGARRVLGADVGIGVTGVAGPEEAEGHRPGTVCIAIDIAGEVETVQLRLPGRRQQIREFTAITALKMLHTSLQQRTVPQ